MIIHDIHYFLNRMGASMPLPGAAWVPQAQAQLTPAATPNGGAMQHSAIAYPTMQQFQVSPQVEIQ